MLQQLQKRLKTLRHLLWACRGMVALGFVTSAAGNVLHVADDPKPIPIGISLIAPVILLAAFEVNSRIPLPEKDAGRLRWTGMIVRILAMAAITIVMFVISYRHQSDAFYRFGGQDHLQADLLPGAIDAFMVIGSVAVLEVQAFIARYELQIAGLKDARAAKETKEKMPVVMEREPTKRERIAILLRQNPGATLERLAQMSGASPSYVSAIKAELKNPVATQNGHATV